MESEPAVRFDMLMPAKFKAALQREADARGISAAAMIRLAISEYVERSNRPEQAPVPKKGGHARA